MIEAFPLHWAPGYPRTQPYKRIDSKFKQTMDGSQKFLRAELQRLGARDLIISTNIPLRKDGGMHSTYMDRLMDDPGVAIYFKYKTKDITMCCDQYKRIWENIYALGKGIEALRGMERWGVSDFLERAFTGFTALPEYITPAPAFRNWFQILGCQENATEDEIKKAYRDKAKIHHPDAGGTADEFNAIQKAYEQGLEKNTFV